MAELASGPHQLESFDYELPEGQVALYPPETRDGGRLLLRKGFEWTDRLVTELPLLFSPGDLLVVNDTRVMAARLFGHRKTGGRVEILVLSCELCVVKAMVRPGRRLKEGEDISLLDKGGQPSLHRATLGSRDNEGQWSIQLSHPAETVLRTCGHMPIPPYLDRPATALDEARYQTVFADKVGAVAAPTASLHLTQALMEQIRQQGAQVATVTLHVGPGTFRNLRTEDIERGTLHSEPYSIPAETAQAIAECREAGGRVTAVGTTVTRTLESAALENGRVRAGDGQTDLFIQPGFEFGVVDRLMTNLHLPRSSLLMLVSAFGGHASVMAGYAHAVANGYRFYSYGDAMMLEQGGVAA